MRKKLLVVSLLLSVLEIAITAQEKPARRMNYFPKGRDIVCVNGQNRYTRALYGGHTLFRLETSDRPIFATYNNEKSKNIRFYLTHRGLTLRLDSTAKHGIREVGADIRSATSVGARQNCK